MIRTALILSFIAILSVPGESVAQIPSAANSEFSTPVIITVPGGLIPFVVTVRDASNNPLGGVTVQIEISAAADALVTWCVGQSHPNLFAVTDGAGVASFDIHAGGCVDPSTFVGPFVARILADSIVLTPDIGIRSLDVVNDFGVPGIGTCNLDGIARVSLADGVFFTAPISLADNTALCVDFAPPYGEVGLSDAVVFTPYLAGIVAGAECTCE